MHDLPDNFSIDIRREGSFRIEFIGVEQTDTGTPGVVFQPADEQHNDALREMEEEYNANTRADRCLILMWRCSAGNIIGWATYRGQSALVIGFERARPDELPSGTLLSFHGIPKGACVSA